MIEVGVALGKIIIIWLCNNLIQITNCYSFTNNERYKKKTTTIIQLGEVELYFNKIMMTNNILRMIRFVFYIIGR